MRNKNIFFVLKMNNKRRCCGGGVEEHCLQHCLPSTDVAVVILTGDWGELLMAASFPGRSAAYVKLGKWVES